MKSATPFLYLILCSLIWECTSHAVMAESKEISEATIREAESILGLEFSSAERSLMAPALERHRNDFLALRQFPLSNSITPALVFDPIPKNFQIGRAHV